MAEDENELQELMDEFSLEFADIHKMLDEHGVAPMDSLSERVKLLLDSLKEEEIEDEENTEEVQERPAPAATKKKRARKAAGGGRSTKLTFEDAEEIRRQIKSTKVSQKELAERYGVSQAYISNVVHHKVLASNNGAQ